MRDTEEASATPQVNDGHKSGTGNSRVDFPKCRRNFWWLTGLIAVWLPLAIAATRAAGIFVPDGPLPSLNMPVIVVLYCSFLGYFIQLGRLAAMNKKSRIIWALLPFMFYFLGGIFMYIRMIVLGKKVGWL